jgi:O-antigen biosynthesis protein
MTKTLNQLYHEHQEMISDKWQLYLNEYQRLFSPYRDDPIQLLEIGIQNGGSLEIWSKYFPKANKIVGCDINERCKLLQYNDPRIRVVIGNANSEECQTEILRDGASFNIILDDGSHKSSDIIRSFSHYFPHISDNGVYVVEDLHCSYWQDYEGGLFDPFSAMSFFKRLADVTNYEHWRNDKSRTGFLAKFAEKLGLKFQEAELAKIHSIEFINSLCVIRKSSPDNNVLGERMVVGTEEIVTGGVKILDGTSILGLSGIIMDDSNLDIFELIAHINSLEEQISIKNSQLQELQQELDRVKSHLADRERVIQKRDATIMEIYNSRTWKLTQKIWAIKRSIAPPGSRRERLLQQFLK